MTTAGVTTNKKHEEAGTTRRLDTMCTNNYKKKRRKNACVCCVEQPERPSRHRQCKIESRHEGDRWTTTPTKRRPAEGQNNKRKRLLTYHSTLSRDLNITPNHTQNILSQHKRRIFSHKTPRCIAEHNIEQNYTFTTSNRKFDNVH